VVRFTTVRGPLLPGDIFHVLCSGSELAISGITVMRSIGDMTMIERTMMAEYTVRNSVVKNGK